MNINLLHQRGVYNFLVFLQSKKKTAQIFFKKETVMKENWPSKVIYF